MTDTMWKCEQLRAGKVYSSMLFDSKEEAEQFVNKMHQIAPDQFFRIEPILAKQVWN
ncbi:MAG: hypothetical protein ACYC46_08865 [Acidobacteriaceae bacterium]|jgi:hypothetical protein